MSAVRARAVLSTVILALAASVAHAEPRDPARADALFRDGRDAMRQRDFESACARFAESQSLDPAPGTLLNLADCEEKLGRIVAALRHVQGALADLPPRDERARIARDRLATLARRLAHVTLRVAPGTPPSGRITRDGGDVAPAELGTPERTDPGNHVYALVLADGREHRVSVVLREGEHREIVLDVAPAPAPVPVPVPPAPAPSPPLASSPPALPPGPPPRPAPNHTAAYVAGGVGVVGVAVASIVGVVLLRKKSTVDGACNHDARTCTSDDGVDAARSGKSLVPVFYGAGVLGVAGLVTAGAMLWSKGDAPGDLALLCGPGGCALRGGF